MNDGIRIRLSLGLVAVAIIHAVLLGTVFTALRPCPTVQPDEDTWSVPNAVPPAPRVGRIEKLDEPQSVNLSAQGEIKQQSVSICPTCEPTTIYSPTIAPQPVVPVAAPQPQPSKKKYQIALFIGSDAKSKQLLDWFNHDPKLYKLRTDCDFQVYTSGNTLYQTRFASIVPVEQFPVVLFQDNTGGHVHAAGRTMLPATAAELYADLHQGYQLYQQTRQAQKTGALKTRGYSWDDAISPKLQLNSEDCPDGYCPVEPTDGWRPGNRDRDGVRDVLFDRANETRNALLWASAGELATIAMIVLAVFLLGFILIKRGM
ncbi:MAG: hypothetical protein WBD20_15785 [Pirellulaceae bacterium]